MSRGACRTCARRGATTPPRYWIRRRYWDWDGTARRLVESGEYDLASLVRVSKISFEEKAGEQYKEEDIDGQKIRIAIW